MTTTQKLTTTAMQTLVGQLQMVGAKVRLVPIVRLIIGFEKTTKLSVPGTAIRALTLVPAKTVLDGVTLAGFQLRLATAQLPAATIARLQATADVTSLTVITIHQTVVYHVQWSPLSDEFAANLNQFYTTTADELELATKLRRSYDWPAILRAALIPEHFETMVAALLAAKLPGHYTANDFRTYLRHQIDTMQAVSPATERSSYLLIRQIATDADRPSWESVVYHPNVAEQPLSNLETMPYAQLLALPVWVANGADVWEGLAWLLWKMAFAGVQKGQRLATIRALAD